MIASVVAASKRERSQPPELRSDVPARVHERGGRSEHAQVRDEMTIERRVRVHDVDARVLDPALPAHRLGE